MATTLPALDRAGYERLRLFAGAEPDVLAAHVARCRVREVARGERLLVRGRPNDATYLLLAGRLGVYLDPHDPPIVVFGPGECAGEMSVISDTSASADVIAEEDSRLLVVPREVLWSLIDESHAVARNLLHVLADRVRHDDDAIREHARVRRTLERDVSLDALTGLYNRRWMDEAFPQVIRRSHRTGQPVALLLIDADHFKAFNDRHGHLAGDMLLRVLARAIRAGLRPADLAARFGGEEFAVLLADTTLETAVRVADRLRTAAALIRIPRATGGTLEGVTVSIGVAGLRDGDTLDSLLAASDAALYRAKDTGRDRVST